MAAKNVKKNQTYKNSRASDVFAANLRGLMAMQGVTAAEMQTYMGIGETTWYKRMKRPYEFTMDNVERAARRLGVAPSDMISGIMTVGGASA